MAIDEVTTSLLEGKEADHSLCRLHVDRVHVPRPRIETTVAEIAPKCARHPSAPALAGAARVRESSAPRGSSPRGMPTRGLEEYFPGSPHWQFSRYRIAVGPPLRFLRSKELINGLKYGFTPLARSASEPVRARKQHREIPETDRTRSSTGFTELRLRSPHTTLRGCNQSRKEPTIQTTVTVHSHAQMNCHQPRTCRDEHLSAPRPSLFHDNPKYS